MDVGDEVAAHAEELGELRSLLGDKVRKVHDDRALHKWLKARNFDVKAAEEMYLKSLEWRRQIGADTILTDFKEPEVIRKYYPGSLFGVAKDGNPVWIEPMGRGDLKGIVLSVPHDEIVKSMVYRMETLYARFHQLSQELNRPIEKCVHIIDVDGFGVKHLWKPVLDVYIAILNMLENNYPETLKASYVVNCPRVFKIGFDFMKKFIDKQTASKIVILDQNWKVTLLEMIDADQLPVAYGGTRVDDNGDPMCGQLICCGGEVPKHYYLGHKGSTSQDGIPLTNEVVGRRRTLTVQYNVENPNSGLRWGFYTASGDLAFGIRRCQLSPPDVGFTNQTQQKEPEVVDIQTSTKYNCADSPIEGLLICDVVGRFGAHQRPAVARLSYIVLCTGLLVALAAMASAAVLHVARVEADNLEFFNPSFLFARNLSYWVELVSCNDSSRSVVTEPGKPCEQHQHDTVPAEMQQPEGDTDTPSSSAGDNRLTSTRTAERMNKQSAEATNF